MKYVNKIDLGVVAATLICIIGGYIAMHGMGLQDVLASGILNKIITALMAVIFVRAMLYMFDRVVGFQFKEWLDASSPQDKAIYLSARFIGVCILFGMILG